MPGRPRIRASGQKDAPPKRARRLVSRRHKVKRRAWSLVMPGAKKNPAEAGKEARSARGRPRRHWRRPCANVTAPGGRRRALPCRQGMPIPHRPEAVEQCRSYPRRGRRAASTRRGKARKAARDGTPKPRTGGLGKRAPRGSVVERAHQTPLCRAGLARPSGTIRVRPYRKYWPWPPPMRNG